MSEVQPQPGDKATAYQEDQLHHHAQWSEQQGLRLGDTIEVTETFTGIIYQVDEDGWVRYHDVDDDTQQHAASLKSATIRIVERADDPSRDLIGSIRGDRFIRLGNYDSGGDWWDLLTQNWADTPAATEPVTGAVPGTPAAQAQREKDDAEAKAVHVQSEACGDYSPKGELGGIYYTVCLNCGFGGTAHGKREPLVVQYGDPEPDTRRTYRSPNGITVEMGVFGWRVIETNGDTLINVPWPAVPERCFPLTEVIEP